MFNTKTALSTMEEVVKGLKEQILLLKAENERLVKQNENLQEAIVSKLAPLAYAEMKADESTPEEGESTTEVIQNWQDEMNVYKDYADQIEKPFWSGAEDMIDKLSQVLGPPNPASVSIHGNEES